MSMPLHHLAAACLFISATALSQRVEPTAVIDTTAGRITCMLFTHERPLTTARFIALAEGTGPDGATIPKPFYDGARINPSSGGIAAGARIELTANRHPIASETTPPLLFDRPGLLAMSVARGSDLPSRLLITDHGNTEMDGRAVVFGQCDDASVTLVASLRHMLQSTDNHPASPVTITHITIVLPLKPLPPIPAAETMPSQTPPPTSGPEPTGPTAILNTTAGRIACRLFTQESPIATSTFLALADGSKDWTDPTTHVLQHNHRFYDGMAFDRVLPDFYLQFGDITRDISGKTDIGFRFKNETTAGLTFDRPGRLAFGNGGRDTNNSELFFALNPMHALDGGYTVIGQCDAASVAVLEHIAHLPRDVSNHPLTPVVIRRIVIQ